MRTHTAGIAVTGQNEREERMRNFGLDAVCPNVVRNILFGSPNGDDESGAMAVDYGAMPAIPI